ncbi:hypothetical protein D3C79_728090 [compost metagenome]
MRGIAQYNQMRAHLLLGFDQCQRVQMPCADLAQGAEAIAEYILQLAQEAAFVDLGQALGVHTLTGPDQRTAVLGQRQQCHGALLGKALEGLPAMGLARGNVGDQGALLVGRAAHMDAQLLAQPGAATVGQHCQVALKGGVIVQLQAITTGDGLHRLHFGRAAPAHHLAVQPLPKALTKPGVLDHVAQRWHALLQRIEAGGAKAPTVRDLDLPDRLGTRADALPHAQVLVDLPGTERKR